MKQEFFNHKTLWRDFYSTLELCPSSVGEETDGDIKICRVRFKGRALKGERVDIYAEYMRPADDEKAAAMPAILLLGDCDSGIDISLMKIFYLLGYRVFMPDYSGYKEFVAEYTRYPDSMGYANYSKAKDNMFSAAEGPKKTCWFEWCCTVRFAYEYLKETVKGAAIGAVGVKAGGEILLKILPSCEEIKCAATLNAFGWQAYRGINKFGDSGEKLSKLSTDKSWMNFITSLDSQNYAPDISAPVLFVCTNHDGDVNMDRVYDTYSRLKSKRDSALLYGVHHMGCVGRSGMSDMRMFLSKYLYKREIYIHDVPDFEIKVDGDGDLVCVARFDAFGDVEANGVLCGEDSSSAADREWSLMPRKGTLPDGSEVYYLNVTAAASTAYVFVFERYSSGFTASSKIEAYDLTGVQFRNKLVKDKVVYSSNTGVDEFYLGKSDELIVAKYFIKDFSKGFAEECIGYGGIKGLLCDRGIITYRVGMTRYSPDKESLLSFDLCSQRDCNVQFVFSVNENGERREYSAEFKVSGGHIWKKYIAEASDFKRDKKGLTSFLNAVSLSIFSDEGSCAVVNNIAWL